MCTNRAVIVFASILFLSASSYHLASLSLPSLSLSFFLPLSYTPPSLTSALQTFPISFHGIWFNEDTFHFYVTSFCPNFSCTHIKHMLVVVGESAEERFIVNIIMTEYFCVVHFRIFVHIYQFKPQSILVFVCVPQFCSNFCYFF